MKRFFSIIAFIISAAFTIVNFWATTTVLGIQLLLSAMGITMEYGKVTFLYKFFTDRKNNGARSMALVLYVCLVLFSIFFSMCFTWNIETENIQVSIISSDAYKSKQEEIQANKQAISNTEKNIEDTKKSMDAAIKSKQDSIASLPRDYITERANQTRELNKMQANKAESIKALNDKLLALNGDLKASLNKATPNAESVAKGFTGFLQSIASFTGKPFELIRFWFYFILSVVFELLASLLWYYAEAEKEEDLLAESILNKHGMTLNDLDKNAGQKNPIQPEFKVHKVPATVPLKMNQPKDGVLKKVEFEAKQDTKQEVSDDILKRYKAAMQKTIEQDKTIAGYKKISGLAGITANEGNKCRAVLERQGIIRKDDSTGRYKVI